MRALVANGRVFTISYYGVQAGRLDTLAGTALGPLRAESDPASVRGFPTSRSAGS